MHYHHGSKKLNLNNLSNKYSATFIEIFINVEEYFNKDDDVLQESSKKKANLSKNSIPQELSSLEVNPFFFLSFSFFYMLSQGWRK
jgi:hypothetical protein